MPSFASIEKMIDGHLFCLLNDYLSQENNAHFVNFGSKIGSLEWKLTFLKRQSDLRLKTFWLKFSASKTEQMRGNFDTKSSHFKIFGPKNRPSRRAWSFHRIDF